MKKIVSLLLCSSMLLGGLSAYSAPPEKSAELSAAGLINDGGFEETALTSSSWKFSGSGVWYGEGDAVISDQAAYSGTRSAYLSDGVIGQKLTLDEGKSYRLEAYINASAAATVDIGFYDGTQTYPANTEVSVRHEEISSTNEWMKVALDFDCTASKKYVAAVYNRSKRYNGGTKVPVYVDDVRLYETVRPEDKSERIKLINKVVSDGTLTCNISVPNGTQGYITGEAYDGNGLLLDTASMRSSTLPQPLVLNVGNAQSGSMKLCMYDFSEGNKKEISLPVTASWTANPSSRLKLSLTGADGKTTALDPVRSYPLYVGDTDKTDFSQWSQSGHGIDTGSSFQLTASVESGSYSAKDIKWSVSDSSILFSNDKGSGNISLRGTRTGNAIATAALPDGTSESCYITVLDNYNRLQVQRIELNADRLTLAKDTQSQLIPIFYPKDYLGEDTIDKSLTWSSSDETVASVDADGKITAVREGTAIITATSNDVGRTAACSVTVTDSVAVTGIGAVSGTQEMTVGDTAKLSAETDSRVIWRSENSYIADVDENGIVTAYANSRVQTVGDKVVNGTSYAGMEVNEIPGTVRIYATTEDGGYTAYYDIQVNDAPVTAHKVLINRDSVSIPKGETEVITAVVSPSRIVGADKNITWESSSSSVVAVSESADNIFGAAQTTLTAVGEGTATVTARRGDLTDTCTVIVTNGEIKTTAEDIAFNDAAIVTDEVLQLTPHHREEVTNKKLLWLASDEITATIDNEGRVQGYRPGSTTVYAIAEDSISEADIKTLKDLKYNTKSIGADNETLKNILEGAVYDTCTLTVTNPSEYIRNLHIPQETVTDTSVNLLWNRSSLIDAVDFDRYEVYVDGKKTAQTHMLGYTVEGLAPESEHSFKVVAVRGDGTSDESETITQKTKPAPSEIINVLERGAKGNGMVNDTYAIQKAIDTASEGAVIWLPGNGHTYYTGALFLKDNITFKVDGTILGSIDPTDYPMIITLWEGWRKLPQGAEWANATFDNSKGRALPFNDYQHSSLINAGTYDEGEDGYTGPYNARNITICGSGQINGNGFTLATNEGPNYNVTHRKIMNPSLRGRTILMQNAQDVYIKDIMTSYSPSWTNHIIFSDRFTFDGVSIISMGNGDIGNGWNTFAARGHILNGDGIDPESCTNMNLFNLYLMTGDDAITLKSGRNKEGNDRQKPCAYIRMTDCHGYNTLAGFGAGSEIACGAHDILMQNMSLNGSYDYLVWIKTMKERGGVMENFNIRDLEASNVNSVVYLDGAYTNTNPSAVVNPADTQAVIRNFVFENVNGGANCKYDYRIEGISASNPIENVVIRGGTFEKKYSTIGKSSNFTIYNCDTKWNDTGSNVNINYVEADPRTMPEATAAPTDAPQETQPPTTAPTDAPPETAAPTDEPEQQEYEIRLSVSGSTVSIDGPELLPEEGAVLIAASYTDGALTSVKLYDVSKGNYVTDISDALDGGSIMLMLWSSLADMLPLTEAAVIE